MKSQKGNATMFGCLFKTWRDHAGLSELGCISFRGMNIIKRLWIVAHLGMKLVYRYPLNITNGYRNIR
ncbi:unnamed protein product [Arabis nemorensis]|uniref:Uncharacterized protein n=1 Tax=Arabis nemorensis TaxID=586526 RepID=A0A565BLH9_9BRAS|nr:unnamed protein product [Arabis nemorensis]